MTSESNATGNWSAALQKAQADMLRQWTEMSQAWAATGSAGAGAPAAAANASAPEGGPESLGRAFLQQCEGYLGVSSSLWELLNRSAAMPDPEQRARQFSDGLAGLQQQFASLWAVPPPGAPPAMAFGMPGMGGMPGMPGMPGMGGIPGMGIPGVGGIPGMGMMPGMGGLPGMGGAFNIPALGPTREQQESWQRLLQLGARCAQAQMQLSGQWNDIIGRALRELGERLAPRLKSGAPPGSMKEIYEEWVEAAEGVYAQAARGSAFVQAQAELTNALSQLRSAQRELVEEWTKQFDLPTRAELNSLHQQLRELKAALAGTRS
ncbi:MAG TPA: poly(R)-hydroxyalkanoic acid synthase subunit PhaE [Steroidobacteraceae bacterium]|nr:poly(R)-hydroxyalkanoic acid synthase subunit PhaE [Steroidobacteraceae bacterium]